MLPVTYGAVDMTAPDHDHEVLCKGCRRLTIQISNQAVYLTFGQGVPPEYGQPEPYLPAVGQILRDFDALMVRAYTPAASLPAGAQQAQVKLIPLTQ